MSTSAETRGELHASNHRIKRLRRLVSQRKARSSERAFVVEGAALVTEALLLAAEGSVAVDAVFVGSGHPHSVADPARRAGVALHVVAPGVLESVLDPVTPQPVAAIVDRSAATVADLGPAGPVVCLVEARDPGNVGTIIRSAEAAGAAGVVLAGPSVDPTNPKAVRASAGACLRLPVVAVDDVGAVLDELAATGRSLVATVSGRPEAIPYDRVPLVDAVIILGNEAHGLAPDVLTRADVVATVPLAGPTESLNLAVAGALFCFEALRQGRSETERQGRSETERQGRSETERQGRSETERQGRSETERQGRSETERQGRSEAERQGRSETERQGRSEALRQGRSETERQGRSETERQGRSETSEIR